MIKFRQKFIEEASDILNNLENCVLQLEERTTDSALIEELFRGLHTLKGTASMFGFNTIGKLTHSLENVYDLIRNGRMSVSKEVLDLTLAVIDYLNAVLKSDAPEEEDSDFQKLEERIAFLLNSDSEEFDGDKEEIEAISEHSSTMQTWYIHIKPKDDLENRGIKIQYIFEDLSETGQIHIVTRKCADIEGVDVYWEIFLATDKPKTDIEDILMFIEDICELELLAEQNLLIEDSFVEILNGYSNEGTIDALKTSIAELFTKTKKETVAAVEIGGHHVESIKVSADRLDEQMNLLSELVTTRAEIQLMVEQYGYKPLVRASERLDKITRSFQNNIFKIRLLPLETMRLRIDRLIRDLSQQLNKQVEFVAEGMHTELDKNIIDSLESPLMHLVRNSLDHGIEATELRKKRGKPAKGRIKLSARMTASYVQIDVSDDGEGIDTAIIREKAVQKGLIYKDEEFSKNQLYELIFAPGFSTAKALTEVSGRGVGMDVVRQTINNLRGVISVSSEQGAGTTFSLKLPLTLSIIDTMLVRVNKMLYSVPLSSIHRCTEIVRDELDRKDNSHLEIEEDLVPYVMVEDLLPVNEFFGNRSSPAAEKGEKAKIVIVKSDHDKTALIVDEVIAEHQAVIKPLGDYFKQLDYYSGATQLASGQVSLVLDIPKLLDLKMSK